MEVDIIDSPDKAVDDILSLVNCDLVLDKIETLPTLPSSKLPARDAAGQLSSPMSRDPSWMINLVKYVVREEGLLTEGSNKERSVCI